MATRTTTQAGNWNAGSTWIGGVAPGAGDRAVVNHTPIPVTADADIGDSPSDTTTDVVTVNAGCEVIVKSGITFRQRGNSACVNGGLFTVGEDGVGGANFIFDATGAGTPATQYICKQGVANNESTSLFRTRGTEAQRSNVSSAVGSGNGYFGNGTSAAQNDRLGCGGLDVQHTNFLRIGDATKSAFYLNPVDNSKVYAADHCHFTSCGDITFSNVPATITVTFDNVTQRGSLGTFGIKCGSIVATPVTGNRWVKHGSLDKEITWSANSLIEDTILLNGFADAAGNGRFSSFARNFIRRMGISAAWRGGDWSECYVTRDGCTYDPLTGLYTATANLTNIHWFTPSFGPTGMYEVVDSVIESLGSDGVGDIDYGPNTLNYNSRLLRCLVIPDQVTDVAANTPIVIDDNAGAGVTYDSSWHIWAPDNLHYADIGTPTTDAATFTFTPGAGTYEVSYSHSAWSDAAWAGIRPTDAVVKVYDNTTLVGTYSVNEDIQPASFAEGGRDYIVLGTHVIASGTLVVKAFRHTTKNASVNAVRIVSTAVNPPIPRNAGTLTTINGWAGCASKYIHCTFYSGGQGPLAIAEAGNGVAHMVAEYLSCLIWNHANNLNLGFNFMAYLPTSPPGIVTDTIDPAFCDYNHGFNIRNDGTNVGSNTNLHYNVPLSATVGVHDTYGDPQFVDSTRNFWTWVKSIAGATLPGNATPSRTDYNAYGLTQLAKLNDADFDARYTLAALKSWVRAGFAPQSTAVKDNGHDGVTRGAVAGSYGVVVEPATASLTLSTFAPTILTPRTVLPTTASLTLSTFAPTILTPRTVLPSTASLVLSTFAPTILTSSTVSPGTTNLSLTGFAPTILTPRTVLPSTASLVLTGFAPNIVVGAPTSILLEVLEETLFI